jgi:tetratricopeptide (TPR) repeat protein
MIRTIPLSLFVIACLIASAPFALGQEAEAKQLAEKSQELAKDKKFDQAIASMKKAIELTPRNDLYIATLSDYELKAGKFTDGLEHAAQAIKLNDKVGAYYVLAAANAYSDQEIDRAREYCETVLKREKEFGSASAHDIRILLDQMLKKTWTLSFNLDPQKARIASGSIAVCMPRDGLPYQNVSYELTGARSSRLVKGDVNDILYIVPNGPRPMALTMKITVLPYSFKKDMAKAEAKTLPVEARNYLGPCFSINPKSAALTKVAAGLKGSNNTETVRNILAWMKKNIEYKLEKKFIEELDFKMVDDIVERGHAECRGYGMLFTALCRAADIPARPLWGLAIIPPSQEKPGGSIVSHNWAECYIAGCGWVPVDPQRPESLGCMPTSVMRFFMDAKKTKTSAETLPMFNLLNMNGDKLKFEETR